MLRSCAAPWSSRGAALAGMFSAAYSRLQRATFGNRVRRLTIPSIEAAPVSRYAEYGCKPFSILSSKA